MSQLSLKWPSAFVGMLLACLQPGAKFAWGGGTPQYVITDLGSLDDLTPSIPTDTTSSGNAINENGSVAGGSSISGGCITEGPSTTCEPVVPHAFIWQFGVITDLLVIGEDAPIDSFPRPESIGWGINIHNEAVGEGTSIGNFNVRGWAHLPEPAYGLPAGMHQLPLFHTMARARSINDSGTIAGEANVSGSPGWHAVIWLASRSGWTITDIALPAWPSSFAHGINNHGEVTGTYSGGAPDNFVFAFLYLPAPAYGLPAGMNTITPQLTNAVGNSINDLGQVAGVSSFEPMLWLPEAAYGLPAGVTVFDAQQMFDAAFLSANGFLFVHSAEFRDINTSGVAVGDVRFGFQNPAGGISVTTRGFAWLNGEFTLTQDLLPQDSPWTRLNNAMAVNDAGQIVGNGFLKNGDSHGYLLEPEPVCVTADLNCDGLLDALDQVLFCAALGSSEGDPQFNSAADLNEDGTIDHLDQAEFNQLVPNCIGDLVSSRTFQPPPDGDVNAADLAFLLGAWGNEPSCADSVSTATFAPPPDGIVDAADLAVLLGAWGRCN